MGAKFKKGEKVQFIKYLYDHNPWENNHGGYIGNYYVIETILKDYQYKYMYKLINKNAMFYCFEYQISRNASIIRERLGIK